MAPPGTLALRQLWPLHGRADDAGAALALRDAEGRFARAGFVRVRTDEQLPLFPKALAALETRLCDRELFATVNGCAGGGWANAQVRRLNAVALDLDGHKLGLSEGQLIDAVLLELREGRLPAWSVHVFSGRGLWLLWLLRDVASDFAPPRATPENVARVEGLNRQLAHRFAHLGGDAGACNVGRLMRAPGSVNTKADKRSVWFYAAAGDLDQMPLYTLEGFARDAGLELDVAPHRHPGNARDRAARQWTRPKKPRGGARTRFDSERAKAAAVRRFRGPLDEALAVIRHRGGLHSGTREEGIWTLAHLGARARWTLDQVLARVRAIQTYPPLCRRRAEYQAERGWTMGAGPEAPSLRFETVAAKLAITREECEALGLELLARALPTPDTKLEAFAACYLAGTVNGKPPTLRDVRAELEARGFVTKAGNPLSFDTLRKLRERAVASRKIPRDVRRRSSKDRQLRIVVENTPTVTPNPSEIVAPASFTEAVFPQESA